MTHRPTLASAANSPDLIHTSTRTRLCTNVDATGLRSPQTLFSVGKLVLRWADGDIVVCFSMQTIDMSKTKQRAPLARR